MHFAIPFTRNTQPQSYVTPVWTSRAPYCHHHRTASADSTEYWVWNGPEQEEVEEADNDYQEDVELGGDDLVRNSTSPGKSEATSAIADAELLSRPERNEDNDDKISFIHERDHDDMTNDVNIDPLSETLLDLVEDDSTTSSQSDGSSFSSDLPSESYSPILRANRRMLEIAYASADDLSSPQPKLLGLGLFGVSRKDDVLHAFDGLGVVHVRPSGDHVEEEEEEGKLSSAFLRDLEALFLVSDFPHYEGPIITVEEPLPAAPTAQAAVETSQAGLKENEQPPAPPSTPVSTATSTSATFTTRIKQALRRPRGLVSPSTPAHAYIQPAQTAVESCTAKKDMHITPSSTANTLSSSSSTASTFASSASSSSFLRRTCSAFRSQYSLNTLRAEQTTCTTVYPSTPTRPSAVTSKSTGSIGGFKSPVKSISRSTGRVFNPQTPTKSPSKGGLRSIGRSSKRISRSAFATALPLTGSPRKVSVSVSMGGGGASTSGTPHTLRSVKSLIPITPVTPITPLRPLEPLTPVTPSRVNTRSLQTHSVRDSRDLKEWKDLKDLRDLSALGTISSELKKRGRGVGSTGSPMKSSGSSEL